MEESVGVKYVGKLLPCPTTTIAPATLFGAIRNAIGVPKQHIIIERWPHPCFLLKFLTSADAERYLFRQPFIVYDLLTGKNHQFCCPPSKHPRLNPI